MKRDHKVAERGQGTVPQTLSVTVPVGVVATADGEVVGSVSAVEDDDSNVVYVVETDKGKFRASKLYLAVEYIEGSLGLVYAYTHEGSNA